MSALIELFAGCGGAALGLDRAGWRHLACVERDPAACATLRAVGLPVVEADVRAVDWSPWVGSVDLLWASPPCQAGSAAGKRRGRSDDRDGWPWTFAAVDALSPIWLLAENVRGWTFHRPGCPRDGRDLSCVGCYWERVVLPGVRARFPFAGAWSLDAADYGVPQRRRRVILWAGPVPLAEAPPPPTHGDPRDPGTAARGLRPWVTLGEAVGASLNRASCDQRRCYPCSKSFGRACKEPGRLALPAPTVTCQDEKGTRAHAPDWDLHGGPDRASDAAFLVAGIRRVELAEGLLLQGFPADWPLQGTVHERYVQAGNAVPPALAEAAGRAMLAAHRVLGRVLAQGWATADLTAALRRRPLAVPTSIEAQP